MKDFIKVLLLIIFSLVIIALLYLIPQIPSVILAIAGILISTGIILFFILYRRRQ